MNAPIPAAATSLAGPSVPVQKVRSPAGVEAWLVEEHGSPLVALDYEFDGGTSADPKGKEGLASATSDMIGRGAEGLSENEIEKIVVFYKNGTFKAYVP